MRFWQFKRLMLSSLCVSKGSRLGSPLVHIQMNRNLAAERSDVQVSHRMAELFPSIDLQLVFRQEVVADLFAVRNIWPPFFFGSL